MNNPFDLNAAIGLQPHGNAPFFKAEWPAPANVHTLITTRNGGISEGAYRSLNLGSHVGDRPEHVRYNRETVQAHVGVPVVYLNQIHGTTVIQAAEHIGVSPDADAAVDRTASAACAAMTADCLPVLFCDKAGTVVAAAHAGWRGLAGGVLQNTIAAMNVPSLEIMAYLGPAIGPDAFEVGQDVFDVFCAQTHEASRAFEPIGDNKYLADIYALARLVLQREGVNMIYGGNHCTVLERETFFSYRREKQTGRMASIIWLDNR
ncbi:Laccase domain protein yfiH [Neisseria zoodegmatis]|uniref:Purine nucleoside phosphorylase n=1 Tax=Neisseria zoodegmatis TaxID=326523 RepID=A0A378WGG0_9NEIS|nr:peptidoglycan editing factor PgeF [Neisseria zoodegmatis]SUA36142.1 Laccase domain protein yfiH [Neisseria zoodegmatis]